MDYELLDSGQGTDSDGAKYGEKLERFGAVVLRRPDPEVLWEKRLSDDIWNAADATFVQEGLSKKWLKKEAKDETTAIPETWVVEVGGLKYNLELGAFKHVGIFPEQATQWSWMTDQVAKRVAEKKAEQEDNKPIKVLNLFGYTGGATCALARAGAEVTHIDALESNLSRAKENLALNGLADAPVRLIADDVRKFVEREIRRQKEGAQKYDAIVMDPPVYGKGGGKGQKRSKKSEWQLEDDFLPLLERLAELLSDKPLFWVISGYASEYSHISYNNALSDALAATMPRVHVESGELVIPESGSLRLLPAGIFARTNFQAGI